MHSWANHRRQVEWLKKVIRTGQGRGGPVALSTTLAATPQRLTRDVPARTGLVRLVDGISREETAAPQHKKALDNAKIHDDAEHRSLTKGP